MFNMYRGLLICLLLACHLSGQALPSAAQALLDKAKTITPTRYQYAIDQGAKILPTTDGNSFYLTWRPAGATASTPYVVTSHGSTGWAFDEFFLWKSYAEKYGYSILALQWYFPPGPGAEKYYEPADTHREFRAALKAAGALETNNLLHGFSRGSANIYAVHTLDRQSGDRYYAMAIANSGGASVGFPFNDAITAGAYGYNNFSGTYWTMFCGGRDPNPDRDGCPGMRRTQEWVTRFGGVVSLFIQDDAADHGGFHQTPTYVQQALDAFKANLAARKGSLSVSSQWSVRRDSTFEIANASSPNAGWVRGNVWLAVGGAGGLRVFRSADGSNSSTGESVATVTSSLTNLGYTATELVPREAKDGSAVLYASATAASNRSAVFRLVSANATSYTLSPSTPVFQGAADEAQFAATPDLTAASESTLRLTYTGGGARSGIRTATSTNDGVSFTPESTNPFGDLADPAGVTSPLNSAPAILRLATGGYLAATIRSGRLVLFNGYDGRAWVPAPQQSIDAATFSPGATMLRDPSLVQLPDGSVFLYVAVATTSAGSDSRVVRARILPAPVLASNSVVNAASLTSPVAPGSIVSIFGANLNPTTYQAASYPLATETNGLSVTIGGKAAPLYYAGPTQVNAQVPFDVPVGQATVQIGSASTTVTVAASAPGIFKLQGDFAVVGTVSPRSTVTIYLTGQGAVNPMVPAGTAAPDSPLSLATSAVKATLGGRDCEVLFAGLAPRFAGLMQLNLAIPALTPGDHSLVVTVGTATSSPALIRVGQ